MSEFNLRVDWPCWRDPRHPVAASTFGWPQCTECGAAPAYHDRPGYVPTDTRLKVYVPIGRLAESVRMAPKSAIVGLPIDDETIQIYFEGWTNGPMQYGDLDECGLWEAGLLHAADRMVTAYPTVARLAASANLLVEVGEYAPVGRIVHITNQEALDSWLGPTHT